jgi:hypothetical protein
VVLSALSPCSAFISIDLSGAKKFRVGTSYFDSNWVSLIPVMDVVGFLALLSASSLVFRFRLLWSRKFWMDGVAVIVILAVSHLATLPLRTIDTQVVWHFCVHHIQGAIQLLVFQMLVEIPLGFRHVFDD